MTSKRKMPSLFSAALSEQFAEVDRLDLHAACLAGRQEADSAQAGAAIKRILEVSGYEK